MEPRPSDDQVLKHIVDSIGMDGWTPEEIKFFIEHPEFEHKPVSIREFIESPKYLNDRDCWPAVMLDLEEIFPADDLTALRLSPFSEIIRLMGIGSGKSFRIRYVFCYIVYRLLCRWDPQHDYGLARDSKIALLNASITSDQAKNVIFGEISNAIKNSPWFQQYGQPDQNVKSELRFPKNILIFPGSSSVTSPLGYNIFLGNIDEAAFFEDSNRDVAQVIYDGLYNRELSRFSDYGMITAISSPNYEGDFMDRKITESRNNPSVNGKVAPTWENNPKDIEAVKNGQTFELEHPRKIEGVARLVKIPLKYEKVFKRNAAKCWCDFGAVASLVLDPYFDSLERQRLEAIVRAGEPVPSMDSMNPCACGAPYFAHIDLGIKRDACGFAIGHRCAFVDKTRIDGIWRIVSRVRAGELALKGEPFDMIVGDSQVQIGEVRALVYAFSARGFFVQCVSYDQFQSLESRQELENKGYEALLLSVDKDMKSYDTFKGLVNSDKFLCCQHEFFLIECSRLESKQGKKVDHPPNGSKDLADSVAGVCRSIAESNDEVVEEEEIIVDDTVQYRPHQENM